MAGANREFVSSFLVPVCGDVCDSSWEAPCFLSPLIWGIFLLSLCDGHHVNDEPKGQDKSHVAPHTQVPHPVNDMRTQPATCGYRIPPLTITAALSGARAILKAHKANARKSRPHRGSPTRSFYDNTVRGTRDLWYSIIPSVTLFGGTNMVCVHTERQRRTACTQSGMQCAVRCHLYLFFS